jgi:hypothetical protein
VGVREIAHKSHKTATYQRCFPGEGRVSPY